MNSDTCNDDRSSWTADMDTDAEESAIKMEPEIVDGDAFELLTEEHYECNIDYQNNISLKRKREQDDTDQTHPDNDTQYLDFPGKGEDVDEAHVKGEPVAMNQPEEVPMTQEADEIVTKGEHYYCCGCNDNIPSYSQFVKHILCDHLGQGIKHFQMKPDISDPNNDCNACERHFKTRSGYFGHLRQIHKFDTKEIVSAGQPELESSVKTDYYCCNCNQYMKDEASFKRHVSMSHFRSKIKHLDVVPDINDPNRYCKACERSFETKVQYAAHLRLIHKMKKRTTVQDVEELLDVDPLPDADQQQQENTDHFCCGCNKYMPDQKTLMRHIAMVHSATKIKHFNVKPDADDPNNYCKACERTYILRGLYRQHLRLAHKMVLPRPSKVERPNRVIDCTQPESFLCNTCNASIKEHSDYLTHIASCHSKFIIKHADVKPDYYDPNHYCKACEKTHPSQKKYRQHLQRVHKIIVQGVTVRVPAISTTESEYFCCACNATVADYTTYVAHITTQHPRSRIKHLHIKPDVRDPNYYCRACEKGYSSRNPYMSHLKVLHNFTVDFLQRKRRYSRARQSTTDSESSTVSQSTNSTETAASLDTLQPVSDISTIAAASPEASQDVLDRNKTAISLDTLQPANDASTTAAVAAASPEASQGVFDRNKSAISLDILQPANDMSTTAPVQREVEDTKTIDIHKAENYCHYCELQYENKAEFTAHLRELHSSITTRSRGNVFSTSSPKPEPADPFINTWSLLSPLEHFESFGDDNKPQRSTSTLPYPDNGVDYYKCDICESHFEYKSVLRQHCKSVHQMQLAPIRYKRNPKVIIRVSHKKS